MNDRSQMAFSPIKQTKNRRSQKKDLKFAENTVDRITRQLVRQTAIVSGRQVNCFSAEPEKALLARICVIRRRAMHHLLIVRAYR